MSTAIQNSIKRGKVKVSYLIPLSLVLCAIIFFVVSLPLATNNLPFLDDYHLIKEQELRGFWGPTKVFQDYWGYYRVVYTSLMSIVFSASEHLWLLRILGMTLHLCTAGMLYILVKDFLHSVPVALLAFAMFLFFPFAYEAIAWPSNVGQYPLAPCIALLGACIVLRYGRPKLMFAISGALLMGFSFWIHEQAGPIVVALAVFLFFKVRQSHRLWFSLAVLIPLSLNLALIYFTRDHNSRLSGPDAASVDYLLINAHYLGQLIRTTPLGDFYYDAAGIRLNFTTLLIVAVALICGAVLIATYNGRYPEKDRQREECFLTHPFAVFLVMAITYLVTLAPILLSPVPWHTARVVYIPFLPFTFAFVALLEFLHKMVPVTLGNSYPFALSILFASIITWQAHALASEALAFDHQIRVNAGRSREAVQLMNKERDLTDTSLLVLRGFPGSDNIRPLFGEHIIGMGYGQFRTALGLRFYQATPTPRISFASGWDGICVNDSGNIAIQKDTLTSMYQWEKIVPENITYIIYADGKFTMSRGNGPRFDPAIHAAGLPACTTAL